MSDSAPPMEKKRFIVLEANDCVARDCATGINYHMQDREEAAGLVREFNTLYARNAELEVKCNTTELANVELRNTLSNSERYARELENYDPDTVDDVLGGEEETNG